VEHKVDSEASVVQISLPLAVTSRTDVARLLRELDALKDFLTQAAIRTPGTGLKLPKTSQMLDDLALYNNLNLLQEADLRVLSDYLKRMAEHAPVLHMSFNANPSAVFINKLMQWLRQEIDPNVLLHVGLQPNLGLGCIVRTPNRQYDLSLRRNFNSKRALLLEKIEAL
jgi:F0F1-type ATP synthase delta subunit